MHHFCDIAENQQNVVYKAAQYGSVYYNKNPNSTYYNPVDGDTNSYASQTVAKCDEEVASGSVTNSTPCSSYTGYGYLIGLNFTGLHGALLYQAFADEQLIDVMRKSKELALERVCS